MSTPLKVLLAEDMKTIRLLLKALLFTALRDRPEPQILEATDGLSALELARREKPDLIISDVEMPGGDGLTLCRAVSTDPALAGTQVILITTKPEYRDAGRAAGAVAFMSKPIKAAELRDILQALVPAARAA